MIEGSAVAGTGALSEVGQVRSAFDGHAVASAFGAGAVAGTLDLAFAITAWSLQGVPAKMIPLSIASGLLGKEAFAGGVGTIAMGIALHFFIAFLMAAAFILASAWAPSIVTRPVRFGAAYGALLYCVMNFIVVPLSRAPISRPPLPMAAADLAAHILLVGIPIAMIAARGRA